MSAPLTVLLVGESWFTYSVHQKGFDTFETADYTEGAGQFIAALRGLGHEVRYIPSHRVDAEFPNDPQGLSDIDVVVLSDVGANTFLLGTATFSRSEIVPNRLEVLAAWVRGGGGLLMIGGYMSFSGIDGKARYGRSPLADVLPVTVADTDDRTEVPQGFVAQVVEPGHPALAGVPAGWPQVVEPGHPALAGVPAGWPRVLGYNRVTPRDGSSVLVVRDQDPILVVREQGSGRSGAFTPDLAPHWAPPEFVGWSAYGQLWESLLAWLARRT